MGTLGAKLGMEVVMVGSIDGTELGKEVSAATNKVGASVEDAAGEAVVGFPLTGGRAESASAVGLAVGLLRMVGETSGL